MSKLFRSALIVAFFFGLEKVLGFISKILINRQFGLSATLDAFYAANNIPDLLFALISGGVLAMAFIPVLSEYLERRGRPLMWDLFSRIANLVFLATAAISIVVAIFAEQLVGWRLGVAPGFTSEQQLLVADLMRINLLGTLLFSLSGLAISGLQANQHFTLPALAPSMYDLGSLFGVLILAPEQGVSLGPLTLPAFGLGIYGVVYGTLIGAALFLLVQLPGLVYYKFRWVPRIDLRHPGVRQVLALMGPRILTVACIQVIFYAQDNIASRLAEGSITALANGWLFMQMPETLIGTALATVLLPTLAQQITRGETGPFHDTLNKSIRVLLALTIPAAVLVAIGIRPLVDILGFDPAGADLVAWATRAFLLGLVGHALLEVAVRAFYSQQDARTPLKIYALGAAAFILIAWLLAVMIGPVGIALANAIVFTSIALALLVRLNRQYPSILSVRATLIRALLAALLGGLVAAGVLLLAARLPVPSFLAALAAIALGALAALPLIWTEVKVLIKL
jgi:putative peptidoglycan lipid II flippase